MKVSTYIEEGTTQIILTPENQYEKEILKKVNNDNYNIEVKKGEFYSCIGGYMRMYSERETENIMMVIKKLEKDNQ
jgi:hypothetical protein